MRCTTATCLIAGAALGITVFGFCSSSKLERPRPGNDERIVAEFILFEKRFTSIVKFDELDSSPKWKKAAANPPLDCRKAIKIARHMLSEKLGFVDKEQFTWDPKQASLIYLDADDVGETWIWRVLFEEGGHGLSGPPQTLEAAVLMNGKAVVPIVSEVRPEDDDAR